ncbi:MAG: hypothetical protein ACK5JT_17810 [Hyphomicrobiaceae bacterium]
MSNRAARIGARLTFGVAIAAMAAANPAAAADPIQWNHNWSGPKREVTKGTEVAAEMVNKLGKGKVKLIVHYGAALGPPKTAPEAVRTGGYEGAPCAQVITPTSSRS